MFYTVEKNNLMKLGGFDQFRSFIHFKISFVNVIYFKWSLNVWDFFLFGIEERNTVD